MTYEKIPLENKGVTLIFGRLRKCILRFFSTVTPYFTLIIFNRI